MLLDLVQNIALLVALAVGLEFLARHMERGAGVLFQITAGALFGIMGVVGMMTPVHFAPGVIYDGRSIILSLAGLFGGPLAATVAVLLTGAYRLLLGGAGVWAGTAVILVSAGLGLGLRWLRRRDERWVRLPALLGFGVVVHAAMLAAQFLIPEGIGGEVLVELGAIVLIGYPLAFLIIAHVFLEGEQRRRMEESVREGEQRLRSFLQSVVDGFWVLDAQGRIVEANEAYCRMSGYDREEIVGLSIGDLDANEDPDGIRTRTARIVGNGFERFETRHRRKDGRTFPVEISVTYRPERGGEFFCFCRNLTERVTLEAQYRQAQKMEAVGQLAGGIAHDFNNLLQAILGYTDILLLEAEDEGRPTEELNAIREAGERAAQLTRQLLAFSRRQVMEPRVVDLNALVEGFTRMIHRVIGEHIQLDWLPGSQLGSVWADPGMLEQVLMNLCVNARDAMPDGGTLAVETQNVRIDTAYCELHSWAVPGRYVLLSVTDNGVGMDEATLARVFEPFFTTKQEGRGSGLGLAMVYGIVKQHEGMISAYSEPGAGTTFKIYLPMCEREATAVGPMIEVRAVGGDERILVVEDNEMVRTLARSILERAGYEVLTAADGLEAVALFEARGGEVDLVFLDVVMPRLGGQATLERMRQSRPDLPALFSSGYSENAIHTQFVLHEGVRMLQKPYAAADLLRAVRAALDNA